MQRKEFIKNSCLVCFGVAAGLTLTGCGAIPIYKPTIENKIIYLDEPKMAINKLNIIQHASLPYDILLVKNEKGYYALRMQCTHQNQPLVATNTGLFCNAHGSSFNLDGKAMKEPAINSLKKYTVTKAGQQLLIQL